MARDSAPSVIRVDLTDGALFGNDAGEDELPEVLNSYFVDQPAFRSFLSRKHAFQVARSRKGMGKSALLSKLGYDLLSDPKRPIIVRATGANLVGLLPPPTTDNYLVLQNYWVKVICARINYEIGKTLGFAFSETDMALVETSEIAGFKERNVVGALLQRVKSSKIPIEINIKDPNNHEELLKRALQTHKDKNVWLLIDDIDSTYIDSPELQALTSTFFSACRALVRDLSGLYIRTTVRTDVWTNFRRNEDLDKCEQYVTDILWNAAGLEIILSKKVYSYFSRNYEKNIEPLKLDYRLNSEQMLEYAFEPSMKWGATMVRPFRPVHILSAGRPRWMSQLCRLAGMEAGKLGKDLIGLAELNAVMVTYSRFRLNDIYKEHAHQYAGLEKLIETFSNSPARYATNELLSQIAVSYINRIGAGNVADIDGLPYKFPMQLAHFLFKIGFIVARREQLGNPKNADFVRYEERQDLLVDARNPDDGMMWEVHPAYRSALNIGREQRVARPPRRRAQRQRREGK